ncbi:MAG: hypothetical protein FJ403_02360 [Verrucomicrobia bacterium]|nr:hypothetical protein [Verrucomicrobiota bacterium]
MSPYHEALLQCDLDRIRSKLKQMAILGEIALRASLEALKKRNRQLAYTVILSGRRINETEVRAAIEATYQEIHRRIRGLVEALRGNN